jgi:hypothetical protein
LGVDGIIRAPLPFGVDVGLKIFFAICCASGAGETEVAANDAREINQFDLQIIPWSPYTTIIWGQMLSASSMKVVLSRF